MAFRGWLLTTLVGATALSTAIPAQAQYYPNGYGAPGIGGILGLLSNQQAEARRQYELQQRAQQRAQQQAMYNQQRAAQAQAEQDREAQARADAEVRQEQAQRDAAAAHQRAVIQAKRDEETRAKARVAAEEAERARAQRQKEAEESPDNFCKSPTVARMVMEEFGRFDVSKRLSLKAIDMEHVTTVSSDPEAKAFLCHTTLVLNTGRKMTGVFGIKPNIAGDMISTWKMD